LARWLCELVLPRAHTAHFDTAAALGGVPEGERDNSLFRLACKLRGADVPQDVAEDMVLRAAAACVPPFPADAARRKVASAYSRYPASTRVVVSARRRGLVNLK
jgi:hypothetical protein